MKLEIPFTGPSLKQFRKLNHEQRKKVALGVAKIKNDPLTGKKLEGELKNLRSARAWPYRILYEVLLKERLIRISAIEHRQSVYN